VKKVFHFDSQTDHYRADACVVSCFDARFELVTRKFLKRRAIWWNDPLKIAGGAKIFASPADESERSFALSQVADFHAAPPHHSNSIDGAQRLRRLRRPVQAFGGDEESEAAHHEAELRAAEQFLKSNVPAIDVECVYLRFTGVWALEAQSHPTRQGKEDF
jgi:hypothetical protein